MRMFLALLKDLWVTLELPPSALYGYLQLGHACAAQFGRGGLHLQCDPLESVARREQLQKPISSFYKAIMLCQDSPLGRSLKKWKQDIPELEDHHIAELKSS